MPKTARWQRALINIYLIISTIVVFVFLGMLFFPCGQALSNLNQSCNSAELTAKFTLAWSLLNAVGYIIFALVAVIALWADQAPRLTKVLASCLLVLGAIGMLGSFARVAMYLGVDANEVSVQRIILGQCAVVEAGFTIIAGSVVTLRPLFGRALGVPSTSDDCHGAASAKEVYYTPQTPQAEFVEKKTARMIEEDAALERRRQREERREKRDRRRGRVVRSYDLTIAGFPSPPSSNERSRSRSQSPASPTTRDRRSIWGAPHYSNV